LTALDLRASIQLRGLPGDGVDPPYITKKIRPNPANIATTSSVTSVGIFMMNPFFRLVLLF
jgi:hypothetical protein